MAGGIDTSIYKLAQQPQPANALQMAVGMGALSDAANRSQTTQLELALARTRALHGELGALASKPDLSQADIQTAADRLARMGLISPDEAAREVAAAVKHGENPAALRNFIGGHLSSVADIHDQFRNAFGATDTQDLGDNFLTRSVSPSLGVRQLSVSPKTLTPQDKATRVGVYQGGQPGTANTSSLTDRYGNARPAPIGGPQGGSGASAGATMAPRGFTPTGPSLGQTAVAEGGAQQFVRDLQSAAGAAGEIANLGNALSNLQGLGAEGTGPGTQGRNRVASFLNSAGLGRLPGVDPKRIEDLDEAVSYLNSAARAGTLNAAPGQAPGAGAPTTPNIAEISQPAALNLVKAQIGLKRLQQAQARSYQGQDNGAGYAQHAATFGSEQDPRAYSFDLRTPAEKQKLIQSLGPKDGPAYRKFMNSLRTAHTLGLTNGGQ